MKYQAHLISLAHLPTHSGIPFARAGVHPTSGDASIKADDDDEKESFALMKATVL